MRLADCHPERKHQARGMCKPCYDKWLKENSPQYKQAQISNTTRWARANPEKMSIIKARRKAKEAADPAFPAKKRNSWLLRKYSITLEQYDELLARQNGGCAICGRKAGKRPLHVDHCHLTGRVRGLLCHQCNWYLGTIEGGHTVLSRLLRYLSYHRADLIVVATASLSAAP